MSARQRARVAKREFNRFPEAGADIRKSEVSELEHGAEIRAKVVLEALQAKGVELRPSGSRGGIPRDLLDDRD